MSSSRSLRQKLSNHLLKLSSHLKRSQNNNRSNPWRMSSDSLTGIKTSSLVEKSSSAIRSQKCSKRTIWQVICFQVSSSRINRKRPSLPRKIKHHTWTFLRIHSPNNKLKLRRLHNRITLDSDLEILIFHSLNNSKKLNNQRLKSQERNNSMSFTTISSKNVTIGTMRRFSLMIVLKSGLDLQATKITYVCCFVPCQTFFGKVTLGNDSECKTCKRFPK